MFRDNANAIFRDNAIVGFKNNINFTADSNGLHFSSDNNWGGDSVRVTITDLATEVIPPPCTYEECWERRKCKAYCTAWEHCDIGLMERGSEEELIN